MCGRYTQTLKADQLASAMSALDATGGAVAQSYNAAPTARMPIVVGGAAVGSVGSAGSAGDDASPPAPGGVAPGGVAPGGVAPQRSLQLARWGLVPSWAKDLGIGSRMFNARAETVAEKPAFRAAFARRRCLVPATGYYEWHRPQGPAGRGQPYFIHPADGELLAFAGLYEVWAGGGTPLASYTIITTGSAGGLEFLHDRSPVILPASAWDGWLAPGPLARPDLLAPAPAGVLTAHPVGPAVGNVRNQGRHLVDRVERAEPAAGGATRPAPADQTLFDE